MASAQAAGAAIVRYNYVADLKESELAGVGATITGSFSYDTDVASYDEYLDGNGQGRANYHTPSTLSFVSGDLSSLAISGPQDDALVRDDDEFDDFRLNFGLHKATFTNGFTDAYIDMNGYGSLFNSVALPQTLDFPAFHNIRVGFRNDTGGFYGKVTSLSVADDVPEPATWAMCVGGFGLIGASIRRREARAHFA